MTPAGGWFGLKWPRSPYLEPVLALLALLFVVTGRLMPSEDNALFWSVDIALTIVAAFAAASPLLSAGIVFLLMLTLIISGDGLATVGFVAVYINTFALVRLQIRHRWWIVAALVVTAEVAFVVETHTFLGEAIASGLMLVVGVVLASVGGLVWRKLAAAQVMERELAQHRVTTLRLALARDLHDTVAQTLSQVAMRSYMASGESLDPKTQKELEAIAADCNVAANDLRHLLTVLRDLDLADGVSPVTSTPSMPLDLALEAQRDRLLAAGLEPDLELDVTALTPSQTMTIGNVMHEAVTNMVKHSAKGATCSIRIASSPTVIVAEFTNQSAGRRPSPDGMGLIGIRERAALLGGTTEAGLQADRWVLTMKLPVAPAREDPPAHHGLTASAL